MPRYHSRGTKTPTGLPLHTREAVAEAFCELAGRVNENLFHWSHASDCFCAIGDEHPKMLNFQWDRQVFDFIAEATMGAMRTEAEIHNRIREAVAEAVQEVKDDYDHRIAMRDLP